MVPFGIIVYFSTGSGRGMSMVSNRASTETWISKFLPPSLLCDAIESLESSPKVSFAPMTQSSGVSDLSRMFETSGSWQF